MKKDKENKNLPLLSVCLITYNHKDYIKQAIEGVLMQQVNFSWELIIADDFSTDGTRDILLKYKQEYPDFIKLIFQEENVGAAKNWIDLLQYSTSEYISYLEGDDYWIDSYKLQKQVDFLENNPDYIIHSGSVKELSNSGFKNYNLQDSSFTIADFYTKNNLFTCTITFRNFVVTDFSSFYDVFFGDWYFYVELMKKNNLKAFRSSEVFAVYRDHKEGITKSTKKVRIHKLQIKQVKKLKRELDIKSYTKQDYKFINLFYLLVFKEYLKKKNILMATIFFFKNLSHVGRNINYKRYLKIMLNLDTK